jgi:hypothetical protein
MEYGLELEGYLQGLLRRPPVRMDNVMGSWRLKLEGESWMSILETIDTRHFYDRHPSNAAASVLSFATRAQTCVFFGNLLFIDDSSRHVQNCLSVVCMTSIPYLSKSDVYLFSITPFASITRIHYLPLCLHHIS